MNFSLRRRVCCGRRWNLRSVFFLALFLFVLFAILFVEPGSYSKAKKALDHAVTQDFDGNTDDIQPTIDTPLHILVPAATPDINLCKLLIGLAVLEYPTPTLLAWNETSDGEDATAESFHKIKFRRIRDYLDSLGPEHDHDLVLLTDAYDVWFQLSPEVLVSRYRHVTQKANRWLRKRLGSAAEYEKIKQSIVFAAGKTCEPNELRSIACYPIPQPPTSDVLYGANTDTPVGRTEWSSYRPRFLDVGFAMGPVKDMHKLFTDAVTLLDERRFSSPSRKPGNAPGVNGQHGADQRVLSHLFGRQEYQRELLRRQYMSPARRLWLKLHGDPYTSNQVLGTYVDDILNPSFTHEKVDVTAGLVHEYGIGLDYETELGHSTAHSEFDAMWINHKDGLGAQVKQPSAFDCSVAAKDKVPKDISDSPAPWAVGPESHELLQKDWNEVPLFTNLCYGSIPVMIHNNDGNKKKLEGPWHKMWYQRGARENIRAQVQKAVVATDEGAFTLADHKKRPSTVLLQGKVGGAWTDESGFVEYPELCPIDWNKPLFGLH